MLMAAEIILLRSGSLRAMAFILALASFGFSAAAFSQEVIDRIAARIENDIILLIDVRQLGRYQVVVD